MPRRTKDWVSTQGKWNPESMSAAMDAVKNERMGVREAATKFGVPKSTLHRRIQKNITDMPASRPTVFTVSEEEELHDHVLYMESIGLGLTVDDVCRLAFEMTVEANISNPFNKEKKRAGYDWYVGFRNRHPDISFRQPEALSNARACMLNPTVINTHFQKLGELLRSTKLDDKPSQIYNADETGFSLVHKPTKILAKKGKKTVQARTSGERGENVTALICANAAGRPIPPFIIFKGHRLNPGLTTNAPADTLFGVSNSSFIDAELFETWFERQFLTNLPPARPVLLVMDGHSSHLTLKIIKLAKSNSVHIFCLPPHTTNQTQPLDKAVFKSMKAGHNRLCQKFMRENPGRVITRYDFCQIFKEVYNRELTMENIINGFRATGVYPFNPHAINAEHLQQSAIETQLRVASGDHSQPQEVEVRDHQLATGSQAVGQQSLLPSEPSDQQQSATETETELTIETELTNASGDHSQPQEVEVHKTQLVTESPAGGQQPLLPSEPSDQQQASTSQEQPAPPPMNLKPVQAPQSTVDTTHDTPSTSKFSQTMKRPVNQKTIQN